MKGGDEKTLQTRILRFPPPYVCLCLETCSFVGVDMRGWVGGGTGVVLHPRLRLMLYLHPPYLAYL